MPHIHETLKNKMFQASDVLKGRRISCADFSAESSFRVSGTQEATIQT